MQNLFSLVFCNSDQPFNFQQFFHSARVSSPLFPESVKACSIILCIKLILHVVLHFIYRVFTDRERDLNAAFVQERRKDWISTFYFPPRGTQRKDREMHLWMWERRKIRPKTFWVYILWHGRKQCTADPALTGQVSHDQSLTDSVRSFLLGPDLFEGGEQPFIWLPNCSGTWGDWETFWIGYTGAKHMVVFKQHVGSLRVIITHSRMNSFASAVSTTSSRVPAMSVQMQLLRMDAIIRSWSA